MSKLAVLAVALVLFFSAAFTASAKENTNNKAKTEVTKTETKSDKECAKKCDTKATKSCEKKCAHEMKKDVNSAEVKKCAEECKTSSMKSKSCCPSKK